MILRHCAGGVVFWENKVLLLKNDKGEWSLPKGAIRHGNTADEVALSRVQDEAGITAQIVGSAGETSYEFFSYSRQRPVCNMITWFIMEAKNESINISKNQGFSDGGFFSMEDSLKIITHNQEKSLVRISHQKVKELSKIGA
ncbi:MAG: NUDIX hydrolase [Desulfitibacter sp. BRH_c19]|nr:MAG: NUDIX hydrolase [Desulfitibacter sp. BRH_c19]